MHKQKDYSEETAAIIDEEIKRIIDTGYKKAKEILKANIDKLHAVAKVFFRKRKNCRRRIKNVINVEEKTVPVLSALRALLSRIK